MKVALAQINTTVGDFRGNLRKIRSFGERAAERGAELVVFPELTVHGYPPRDLLELQEFVERGRAGLEELCLETAGGPALVVGFVEARGPGLSPFNAAAFLRGGEIHAVAHKSLLPNYDVFDERRYFEPSRERCSLDFQGQRIGLSICEDIWNDPRFWKHPLYDVNPLQDLEAAGCRWTVNISGSPYCLGKTRLRRRMLQAAARHHHMGIMFCNLVGGNDSLIFDGGSMLVAADGTVLASAPSFEEALVVADLGATEEEPAAPALGEDEEIYRALVLGLRDYASKTGFRKAILGLSGGIDSAVTAVLAAEALGASNVLGVAMPSRYTSDMSNDDACELARRLGISFERVPIEPMLQAFEGSLARPLADLDGGLARENLQARIRGSLLMAFSNRLGHLVLTTGNKSEVAVGYCTLYGDMAGGLAVISDVFKTRVYRLADWINRAVEVIPRRILERPPSAELRPDQRDVDSLPPYEQLDPLLLDMVERRLSTQELTERGHDPARIREIRRLLIGSEYKRRQAPPTLILTPKAFGEGRRYPIAQKFGQQLES